MSFSSHRIAALAVATTIVWSMVAIAQDALVKGEVKKIDVAAGKITLKHGPIKSLDMDDASMTMVFKVQDPEMLKQVKAGDKVQFEAVRGSNGIVISRLQKAR